MGASKREVVIARKSARAVMDRRTDSASGAHVSRGESRVRE